MKKRKNPLFILLLLSLFLIGLIIWSLNTGKMALTPNEIMQIILGNGTANAHLIIFEFRLPKILLGIFVGIGMGISGCLMQSLLKNDMASPGTLGISSGSGVFVIFALMMGMREVSPLMLPIMAFIGGLLAAGLIFIFSYQRGKQLSPLTLILTGVALATGYDALTLLFSLRMDTDKFEFAQRWMAGSLWGDQWSYLIFLIPCILILSLWAYFHSIHLNALHLGNESAIGLGVSVKKEFLLMAFVSILLSSVSVAIGGNFFFVGMISPHIAKKMVGVNHKYSIPASGLVGGIIILLSDTLLRASHLSGTIPVGLLITIISTPYFLYLLARSR